jgi:hypothetical protein
VEFRLCPRNSTKEALDQSCFDRYPLWIDESHGTRYYIGSRGGIYDIHIRLPGGLVCKKCVLQWKYKTGWIYYFTLSNSVNMFLENIVFCIKIVVENNRSKQYFLYAPLKTGLYNPPLAG